MAFILSHCYLLLLILPLANHIKIVKVGFGNLIIIGSSSEFPNNCFLTCSFFCWVCCCFCKKKEQAKGESIGERSKGRGEMDVWERVASACNYQLKSAPLIEEIEKVVY